MDLTSKCRNSACRNYGGKPQFERVSRFAYSSSGSYMFLFLIKSNKLIFNLKNVDAFFDNSSSKDGKGFNYN